ncbi:hypothetical protein EI77_01056 [Prosthecobacter fusiformis]|uniref:Lipoprotein n=1 Tax=Prosthecobacter fusiformis TaxID=48464 RepID=A0A4R7STC1_9BACT|nr:hypothetical protein [Prosthecobacter fusiformis]TDU81746.1 hypothetical protein EI77_01056 [Prosthecobacter fusiformis]
MKRIIQILCLAVATLGLSNCTAYVEDTGYVASRPGHVYRGAPYHHRGPYYGSARYNHGSNVAYRTSSRYGRSHRDYDRNDRHRHDSRHNVRHHPRSSRSSIDARLSTNVGLFR